MPSDPCPVPEWERWQLFESVNGLSIWKLRSDGTQEERVAWFAAHRVGTHRGEKHRFAPFADIEKARAQLMAAAPDLRAAVFALMEAFALDPGHVPDHQRKALQVAFDALVAAGEPVHMGVDS